MVKETRERMRTKKTHLKKDQRRDEGITTNVVTRVSRKRGSRSYIYIC